MYVKMPDSIQALVALMSTRKTMVNPNESLHTTETTDQNNVVIVDALLSYITFSLQNSSAENVKNAVLGHFTED